MEQRVHFCPVAAKIWMHSCCLNNQMQMEQHIYTSGNLESGIHIPGMEKHTMEVSVRTAAIWVYACHRRLSRLGSTNESQPTKENRRKISAVRSIRPQLNATYDNRPATTKNAGLGEKNRKSTGVHPYETELHYYVVWINTYFRNRNHL